MAEGEMRFDSNSNSTTQFRSDPLRDTATPIDINERVEEMAEQMQSGRNFRFKSTLSTTEPKRKDPTSIKKQQFEVQEYDTPNSTPALPKPRLGIQPNHTEENIQNAPTNPAVIQARSEKLANMPISMLKQLPIFMNSMIEILKNIDETLDQALQDDSDDGDGETSTATSSTASSSTASSSPSEDISELGKAISFNHSSSSSIRSKSEFDSSQRTRTTRDEGGDETDVGNLGNGGREENSYSFVPPPTMSSSSSSSSTGSTNSELEFYDDAKVSAFDVMKEISDSMLEVMTQLYNFEGVDATKMSDLAIAAKDMAVTQIQEFQKKLEAVKKKMEAAQKKAKKNKKIMDAVKWTMTAISIAAVPFSGGLSMIALSAALTSISIADSETGFMKKAMNSGIKNLTADLDKIPGMSHEEAENLAIITLVVTALAIAVIAGGAGGIGESGIMKALIIGSTVCTVGGMAVSSSDVIQEKFAEDFSNACADLGICSKEDAEKAAPIVLSCLFILGALFCAVGMVSAGRAEAKRKAALEVSDDLAKNAGTAAKPATSTPEPTPAPAASRTPNDGVTVSTDKGTGAGDGVAKEGDEVAEGAGKAGAATKTTTATGDAAEAQANKASAMDDAVQGTEANIKEAKKLKAKSEANEQNQKELDAKVADEASANTSRATKIKESVKKADAKIKSLHQSNEDGTMSTLQKLKMAAEGLEVAGNATQANFHLNLSKIYEEQADLIGQEGDLTAGLTMAKSMLKMLQESLQRQGSGIDELSQTIVFVKNNIDDLWRKGGQALNFSGM